MEHFIPCPFVLVKVRKTLWNFKTLMTHESDMQEENEQEAYSV